MHWPDFDAVLCGDVYLRWYGLNVGMSDLWPLLLQLMEMRRDCVFYRTQFNCDCCCCCCCHCRRLFTSHCMECRRGL